MISKSKIVHEITHILLIIVVGITLVVVIDRTRDTPNYQPSRQIAKGLRKLKKISDKTSFDINDPSVKIKLLS